MPAPDLDLAVRLFAELAERTRAAPGFTRPTYGEGEQIAHDIVRRAGEALGLAAETDAAGNLYLTLRGSGRGKPILIGSHLDTVPHGGNYDGAAGVIAGLAAAAGFVRAGVAPPQDVVVMAIRGEESTWFPVSYIGSRAALGLLPAAALEARRADTGRTLADHMRDAGADPDSLRRGEQHLAPDSLGAFIEVHIEQGPVLEEQGIPLGLVTGIRGSFRHREARCLGAYGHSGAEPRRLRRDAVFAVSHLVAALDALWQEIERAGGDLTVTLGQVSTDPAQHAFSKVPGDVRFALDVRSQSTATLADMRRRLNELCRTIGEERRVAFELGPLTDTAPALMDGPLRARCASIARGLGIPALELASGAGHDAAIFANAGVPTAMLFIRNAHGSHNPDEAMTMADFAAAARVLTRLLAGA